MLLLPNCSLASKLEMKRGKKTSFIKSYIFAISFKTSPKITVTIYGYWGPLLSIKLGNLEFILETFSMHLDIIIIIANRLNFYHQLWVISDHFGQYFQILVPNVVTMSLKEEIKPATYTSNFRPSGMMTTYVNFNRAKPAKEFYFSVKHQIPLAGFRSIESNWSLRGQEQYQLT